MVFSLHYIDTAVQCKDSHLIQFISILFRICLTECYQFIINATCKACGGTGLCPACHGNGHFVGRDGDVYPCLSCNRSGQCRVCHGQKRIRY